MKRELLKIKKDKDLNFWVLSNNTCGVTLECPLVDTEIQSEEALSRIIGRVLSSVKSYDILVRFDLSCGFEDEFPENVKRIDILKNNGVLSNKLYVSFEIKTGLKNIIKNIRANGENLEEEFKLLERSIDLSAFKELGLEPRSIEESEIRELLPKSTTAANSLGVDTGHRLIGVIRFFEHEAAPPLWDEMAYLKDRLPRPFKICTSVKRVPKKKAEDILQDQLKHLGNPKDLVEREKVVDTENKKVELKYLGQEYYLFEWVLLLERYGDGYLRAAIEESESVLQRVMVPLTERKEAYDSYFASMIGGGQLVPLYETNEDLYKYLPIQTKGDGFLKKSVPSSSMVFTRRDHTLSYFANFDRGQTSYSSITIGETGSGKSVFRNLRCRAALNDPSIMLMMVDVGSYRQESLREMGVEVVNINTNVPCGINPFDFIEPLKNIGENPLTLLSNWLGAFLLEEGEKNITRTMRATLESEISKYMSLNSSSPTLEDFFNRSGNFPRKELLGRWVGKGMYSNVFRKAQKSNFIIEGAKYFNLADVFTTNDESFTSVMTGTILVYYNFYNWLAKSQGKKVVLDMDETPILIENNFDLIVRALANIRKETGAMNFYAQHLGQLMVGGRTDIVKSSPNRFLFNDEPESTYDFHGVLGINDRQRGLLKSLRREQDKFTEILFEDHQGARVLRLTLDPIEYWEFTSIKDDYNKLNRLLEVVPGLQYQEAIEILSRGHKPVFTTGVSL